ncbi:MAG: RsmF rRNA methyltransferase first C-terminal domain-containing protein [Lachnospiraceae bacterium]|nr:RsmF rRNA methyltransferase first C-terminal domain-containing protein [Lachnospiraceae bacterium]
MRKPGEELPPVYVDRMRQLLGPETPAFFHALEEEPVRGLRVNRLKEHEGFSMETGFSLEKVPWCPDGYYYRKEEEPGKNPLHEAGAYYIQEPSAMAPVMFLSPQPFERVLDLCAAPGGKSTQIAERMAGTGVLIANEPVPERARTVVENMERMGIRNFAVTSEMPERLALFFPEWFDRILVDAPCSGEGMFRKNPAAVTEWSPEIVGFCAERQRRILDSAAQMLSPGGRLVYSTCTFSPEEDEENAARFLENNPSMRPVEPDAKAFPVKECGGMLSGCAGCLKLFPHRVRGEGHFVAVFEKTGNAPASAEPHAEEKSPGPGERLLFEKFCRDALWRRFDGEKLILHGTELFMTGGGFPSLKGLRVLRQGLHLGTFKKNRFEPSHALAHFLAPAEAVRRMELDAGEAVKWIHGEALPFGGERGWSLVCVEGFGLGWGKCDGRLMKNHYPKGLRR